MKFAESLRSRCTSQKVPMAEVRFCVLDPPRTPRTDFLVALWHLQLLMGHDGAFHHAVLIISLFPRSCWCTMCVCAHEPESHHMSSALLKDV